MGVDAHRFRAQFSMEARHEKLGAESIERQNYRNAILHIPINIE